MVSHDPSHLTQVGHNALGAGQIIDQGARLVDDAIASGSVFGYDCGWKHLHPVCGVAVPYSVYVTVLHSANVAGANCAQPGLLLGKWRDVTRGNS